MKNKTVDKEIEEKKLDKKEKLKIPKEVSQEILKKIFRNMLKAIGVMIYFVVLNLAYNTMKQERLIGDIKIFAGIFLVLGILTLEKAYKKDSGENAISAIELICLSLHTLSIMHVITLFKYDFRIYLLTSSYAFSIYYVLKSIIIYTKERKRYLNSLSDISEIVKEDEPIKKEAKKRNSEDNDEIDIENSENKKSKEKKIEKEISANNKKKDNSKSEKSKGKGKGKTKTETSTKKDKTKTNVKQETVKKQKNDETKKATQKEKEIKDKDKVKKEPKKEKSKKEVKIND